MPSFQRNAPQYSNYLSSLLTRTITHQGLVCRIIRNRATIEFPNEYTTLGKSGSLRVLQKIAPNATHADKVTVLSYSYAYVIGPNPDEEPLVRYEYVPEQVARGDYPYPVGHMHIRATSRQYDAFMASHDKKPLHRVHFPTGRISLEEFIRLLIVEFHVPTRNNDPIQALALLDESRRVFLEQKKTKD